MRVLCAYRDPESGDAALRAIRSLLRDGDDVVVVHIVEPADLPWGASEADFVSEAEREMDEREVQIREAAAAVGLRGTVVVDVANPGQSAAEWIGREARERGADVVVVVSKRASGVRGLLLGSVAQGLLELAPCPVLVVRPPQAESG